MEVSGNLAPILGSNLVCLQSTHLSLVQDKKLLEAIDELGKLCAKHSGNKNPLTSCEKLVSSGNVLYLVWEYDIEKDTSRLLGYLKVGRKQLYISDKKMNPYEGNFVCLLDFYVHYAYQRKRLGSQLFSFMMENEHVNQPGQLAFDNPSVTLLSFLAKKFCLDDPIWQSTNFVVFPQLFPPPILADKGAIPEGWARPSTPRSIGLNANGSDSRWLEHAISGHAAAKKVRQRQQDAGAVNTDQLAHGPTQPNQARQARQQCLRSQPFW